MNVRQQNSCTGTDPHRNHHTKNSPMSATEPYAKTDQASSRTFMAGVYNR